MNSLNLRQIDGGNVIKQADFGSNLSFELLDERRRKIPELDGQTATIRLIKGDNIAYQTESQVVDGTVSFKFDRVLEKGIYVLEIVADNYVFPSNNMVKITIEKTAGNYKPENMVKTDLVELQRKITAIEQREHDVNQELLDVGQKQAEMTKRIEILESREDHDTIYDDTEIKERLSALEKKEDKDTVYDDSKLVERIENLESDDTAIKERIGALEEKPDKDIIYDDTNLKSQIVELESKLQSLNTVRRAPTGYTLDRTTTPWTVWFDNGCGMTIPEYGTTASIYGYGQGQNAYNNNFSAYPLPPTIMSVSHGTLTIEKIKTIEGSCDFWASGIKIINPIRDRNDYDWTNARFNKASLDYAGDPYYSYKYVRQQYFIRTMYELGIWSGEIVEEFGATKK